MNFLKLLPTNLLDTFLRVKFKSYLPLVVVVVDVVVVIVEVVVVAAIILKIKSIMFFICLYQLSFDLLLCLIPLYFMPPGLEPVVGRFDRSANQSPQNRWYCLSCFICFFYLKVTRIHLNISTKRPKY